MNDLDLLIDRAKTLKKLEQDRKNYKDDTGEITAIEEMVSVMEEIDQIVTRIADRKEME